MSSGNRKRHRRTSSYGIFKKGSGTKAININRRLDFDLVNRKKSEITDLITKELKVDWRCTRNSKRSLHFELFNVGVDKIKIKLEFILWTDIKKKPCNWENSRAAGFFLRLNEDVKKEVLSYLEGIQKGLITEYLGFVALEELQIAPLQERKILYFRRAPAREDMQEGKDAIVIIIREGRNLEIPIQFKSSYEELMNHKERFSKVPGLFREFTGNLNEEMNIIKEKIVKIIYAYKENKIIFI